ncbi:Dolichyl-diphosphooligosaccharide--protein glycosyltransferase subunit 1A [Dionaea muscipula]
MKMRSSRIQLLLLLVSLSLLSSHVLSDLVISKVDRRVDLTSHIVRIISIVKVENEGDSPVSNFFLAFPDHQATNLAFFSVAHIDGKGKTRGPAVGLPFQLVNLEGAPPAITFYSVSLPKELPDGESLILEVLAVFAHALRPFPEEITQDNYQLVLFQDSSYFLSPYAVKSQTLTMKLPDARVESYTKLESTKIHGSEIKYGPYEDLPPFSFSPIAVHFEDNHPFVIAEKLVREIEISHWGNVQITEYYNIIHGGAHLKGEFSRLDFQSSPRTRGASAFNRLIAKLPPRAHSVYYRDDIGNISTSNLYSDLRKTELEIEPRYPMFGGWRTAFTIGYGLPLKDFLFEAGGKRFLNISYGSPVSELLINDLIVKVILPEGSTEISAFVPFHVKEWPETKLSHLDIAGRPVIVLRKESAVPEHNQHFQVYYKFNSLSLLREPLMLISGFFFLFVACIVYMHADVTISKSSASYLAKLQWDEVQTAVHRLQSIINNCLAIHEKLEASLRELSRSGNVQACKATRKLADSMLRDLSKDFKPLLSFLQTCPQAAQILPKVEELVAKEKELQEKLLTKHTIVVDSYERKVGGREIENRVAPHQQKITVLRQEVDDLLEFIDEI